MPTRCDLNGARLFHLTTITEVGRTSRLYSELAQTTEPTVSDVELALIDAGTTFHGWSHKIQALTVFSLAS